MQHTARVALVPLLLLLLAGCDRLFGPSEAELQITDIEVGTGEEALPGDSITVHYRGWLEDGTVFDDSRARGEPAAFRIGVGRLIAGWDQGIPGMREGGVRELVVPPHLGYGSRPVGPIPPNSTLYFEVELLRVER